MELRPPPRSVAGYQTVICNKTTDLEQQPEGKEKAPNSNRDQRPSIMMIFFDFIIFKTTSEIGITTDFADSAGALVL